MAVNPNLFKFYAPTPQAVDFSVFQRGAETEAALYQGAAQAIAGGITRGYDKAEERRLKQERDTRVQSFQNEITNEDNYDTKTYRLAEYSHADVLEQAQAEWAKSKTEEPVSAFENRSLTKFYQDNGYSPIQAQQISGQMLTPQTARIMRPGVAAKFKAMGIGLMADNILSAEALDSAMGNDVYQNDQDFLMSKIEMSKAIGRPTDLPEIAKMNAALANEIKLLREGSAVRRDDAMFQQMLGKDMAEFSAKLETMSLEERERLRTTLEFERYDLIDKLKAADDEASRMRLMKEQARIDERLQGLRIEADKVIAGTRNEQAAARAAAEEMAWDKSEANVVRDLQQSFVNNTTPYRAIPLTAVYGDDVSKAAEAIAQELGMKQIALDQTLDIAKLKTATIRSIPTQDGGIGIDVELPGVTGEQKQIAEAALEAAINTRYQNRAGEIVGLTQATGSRVWTSDAAKNVMVQSVQRDPSTFGLMNDVINRSLRVGMSSDMGKAPQDFYTETPEPKAQGAGGPAKPAGKPSLGGATPKATVGQ